jgi:hypothetical protein
MSFIELHPDLHRTNDLLERIACSLERYLFETYKVRMGHMTKPAADPHPEEKVTVGYATDEDTARRQLERLARVVQGEEGELEAWMEQAPEDRYE